MPLRLSTSAAGFAEDFAAYVVRRRDVAEDVSGVVTDIIADVRARGDAAVIDAIRTLMPAVYRTITMEEA